MEDLATLRQEVRCRHLRAMAERNEPPQSQKQRIRAIRRELKRRRAKGQVTERDLLEVALQFAESELLVRTIWEVMTGQLKPEKPRRALNGRRGAWLEVENRIIREWLEENGGRAREDRIWDLVGRLNVLPTNVARGVERTPKSVLRQITRLRQRRQDKRQPAVVHA